MDPRVELAARNNAHLCDAVCRAHGQATNLTDQVWTCLGTAPRFYSSLTTLAPGVAEVVFNVDPGGFKDGFNDIDATSHGYALLFDAFWIWHPVGPQPEKRFTWRKVTTERELLEWEQGWAAADLDASRYPRQFPNSLLNNSEVAFVAGHNQGELVAGCILNLTPPVVGISNLFGDPSAWHDLPGLCHRTFPGLEMVGYERGEDLEAARSAGFQVLAPLRVWVKLRD